MVPGFDVPGTSNIAPLHAFTCASEAETLRIAVVNVRDSLVVLGKALPISTESHINAVAALLLLWHGGVISLCWY